MHVEKVQIKCSDSTFISPNDLLSRFQAVWVLLHDGWLEHQLQIWSRKFGSVVKVDHRMKAVNREEMPLAELTVQKYGILPLQIGTGERGDTYHSDRL